MMSQHLHYDSPIFQAVVGALILFMIWGMIYTAKQKGKSLVEGVLVTIGAIAGFVLTSGVLFMAEVSIGFLPAGLIGLVSAVLGAALGGKIARLIHASGQDIRR